MNRDEVAMSKYEQAIKDIKYELLRNHKLCKLVDNKFVLKDKWQRRVDLLEEISTKDEYIDKLNNALDNAVKLLDENMLCEKCPYFMNRERCTVEGCKDYLKECLLEGVHIE